MLIMASTVSLAVHQTLIPSSGTGYRNLFRQNSTSCPTSTPRPRWFSTLHLTPPGSLLTPVSLPSFHPSPPFTPNTRTTDLHNPPCQTGNHYISSLWLGSRPFYYPLRMCLVPGKMRRELRGVKHTMRSFIFNWKYSKERPSAQSFL